jgi:putative nucleotidyltransferase with HDIG domain
VWQDLSLRTRVARRIVGLFLLTALAPLCAFAVLSSWMVSTEMRRQTSEGLRGEAKDLAMAATQNLQHVEAQLRLRAVSLGAASRETRERARQGLDASVEAVLAVDASGRAMVVGGQVAMPALSLAQRKHLEDDRAVLVIQPSAAGARPTLVFVVPVDPSGARVVVRLDERIVWNLGDDSTRPALTGLCVFDVSRTRLACSEDLEDGAATVTLPTAAPAGHLQWSSPNGVMLGGYWSAPLAHQFSVPALTFLLARPAADVEQPIQRFRRAFTVVVAVTLASMAWVSLRQIRRTLEPLGRLQDASEQIRQGLFDARVDVTSRDEFEALGASFNQMATEVQRQFTELKALHLGTLEALARAIDAKSSWTAGHSQRVTALGVRIATAMKLSPDAIEDMRCGGLLHDIGKLGVPGRILDKPGPLTDEEFAIMRQHPEMGARILEPLPQYAPVIPIVMEHHERFDGSGYPRGLAGAGISVGGRIFAVADVFDAMSSDRPYRHARPPQEVIAYIADQAGRMFDPAVVRAFLQVVAEGDAVDSPKGADGLDVLPSACDRVAS